MENCFLYPSSSLNTVSLLRLVIGHREVPLGTSLFWLLRVRTPHSSTSVLLSLLFGARNDIMTVFCLHTFRQKLGPGGAVSASKGSLRAGSAFFGGLLQPLVFLSTGLGVVAAILILSPRAQDSSSGLSCICFFRCIRVPDTFFNSWSLAKFSISWHFAWVSPRLRRSSRESWLRFGVFSTQSWFRLRPELPDCLLQVPLRK